MPWLIIMLLGFAGLRVGLNFPTQPSIVVAAVVTIGLWIIWKLKWVILGIIGLEEIFGGRDGNS